MFRDINVVYGNYGFITKKNTIPKGLSRIQIINQILREIKDLTMAYRVNLCLSRPPTQT